MKITWFGAASLRLETAEGRILVDPFLRQYGDSRGRLRQTYQKETSLLITHGHFDHIASICQIYGNRRDMQIYASKTPIETMISDGIHPSACHIIQPGDCFSLNGFQVHVWKGAHVHFDKKQIAKTVCSTRMLKYWRQCFNNIRSWKHCKENGETVFYELTAEGRRIQIMGSAALDEEVQYPVHADLLLLAYQGRSDLVEYVRGILDRLQPQRVMLTHFDDAFPPISSEVNIQKFADMMAVHYPQIKVMIPQLDVVYEPFYDVW